MESAWVLSDGTTVTMADVAVVDGDSGFADELRRLFGSRHTLVCVGLPPAKLERFDATDPLHVHDLVTNTARLEDVRVLEAPELKWPAVEVGSVVGRVY